MSIKKTNSEETKILKVGVFRSTKHIQVQITDQSGKTLITLSDLKLKKANKTEKAKEIGRLLSQSISKLSPTKVVFDRGNRPFHGRIKAVADGLKEGGIKI